MHWIKRVPRIWGFGVEIEADAKRGAAQVGPEALVFPGWVAVACLSLCQALALPPFGFAALGFLAPAGLVLLCSTTRPVTLLRVVFWWGVLQWMLTFHFIRLPHWAGWIGWPLLAAYFSLYNVALVGLSRQLVQVGRWSTLLAIPLVWVGLEMLRSTLFSGFPIGLLAHSLFRLPLLIQTADIAGELTVTFLMTVVGAGVGRILFLLFARTTVVRGRSGGNSGFRPALPGLVAIVLGLGIMIGYGLWRMPKYIFPPDSDETILVGLVQGALDVRFDLPPDIALAEETKNFHSHRSLTQQARENSQVAAVIWAESMFPAIDVLPFEHDQYRKFLDQQRNPSGELPVWRLSLEHLQMFREELPWAVREVTGTGPRPAYPFAEGLPLIVGMRTYNPGDDRDYNAAVHFAADGSVAQRYFKTHLVPFGEYLPLGDWFPWLYQLAPMPRGLSPGDGAQVFQVRERRLVPTICYESVMGVLVRSYLRELDAGPLGQANPSNSSDRGNWDAMLNMSNDGWFWGSNALDLHLASNVFRAVENRGQHLVVCNTGISANIAADGVIVQEASKRKVTLLLATVYPRPSDWQPWWWTFGPWPWWGCLAAVFAGISLNFKKTKTA